MPYNKFTWDKIQNLGYSNEQTKLFKRNQLKLIEPSVLLKGQIALAEILNPITEKAKSEAFVFPILQEIWAKNREKCKLMSGENLDADKKKGLNGECDFIFTKEPKPIQLTAPIFTLVEAKKDKILEGTIQCAAQMIGAQLFNQQRNKPIDIIYGCATNVGEWKFLKLEGAQFYIDRDSYFFDNLPLLLGVLQHIIDVA